MNLLKYFIVASLFIVPLSSIFCMTGTIVWYPQFLSLIFFGVSSAALIYWKMNKYISLLLIYETLSYIFICQQSPRSFICVICGLVAVAIAYSISHLNENKLIFRCLILLAIGEAIYTVVQSFNVDPIFHLINSKNSDVVGFLGSHNQLGIYCSMIGPLLFSFSPFLSIFSFLPILLAKQNVAVFSLIIGIITYLIFMKKIKICLIFVGIILLLLIPWIKLAGKSPGEMHERLDVWKLSISQTLSGHANQEGTKEMFPGYKKFYICNPLFGFGIGRFFEISPLSQYNFGFSPYHRYEHAHNDFIEAFFELGFIGISLVLLCIFSVILAFFNAYHCVYPNVKNLVISFSCLVTASISSLGVYVFHAPVSLFMFFIFLGLFYGEVNNANKSKIKQTS